MAVAAEKLPPTMTSSFCASHRAHCQVWGRVGDAWTPTSFRLLQIIVSASYDATTLACGWVTITATTIATTTVLHAQSAPRGYWANRLGTGLHLDARAWALVSTFGNMRSGAWVRHSCFIACSWLMHRSLIAGSLPGPAAYYFDIDSKKIERSTD